MTQTVDLGRGALLTLTEAADACGVSRSTMKRRLPEFENARQDDSGSWRVPVSDLLGAGLKLRPRPETRANDDVIQGHDLGQNGADLVQARARIDALTAELAAERTARKVAEAELRRADQNLEDFRLSLRVISGPVRAPEAVEVAIPAPVAAEPVQPAAGPVQPVSGPVPRRAVVEPEGGANVPRRRSFRAWLRGE